MGSLSVWVDESEKGGMLVVAGVLVDWVAVPSIVHAWRRMKSNIQLPEEAEVKWSLSSQHPTRQILEQNMVTTRDVHAQVVNFVTSQGDLTCVAVVMREQRRELSFWRSIWSKASVRDFYCEGLKYLLQRAAEEIVETRLQDCVVICDTPELGKKSFASGTIRRGPTAVEETYREWHRSGVGPGPGKQHHQGPLSNIGFHPSVLTGDATYHDMLQIADVIAGVTGEWVNAVRTDAAASWEFSCFKAVGCRFRSRHGAPGFFGDGFVLWPWENELWERLKQSVK